jgi:3-dehydroquinate dehydratase
MEDKLDLIQETIDHFAEGAKSVRAYTNDTTYIITSASDKEGGYWIVTEEPGFKKLKVQSLESYYTQVFGIEARY